MRDRLKSGESPVHLVSCLIDSLEFYDESDTDEQPHATHLTEVAQTLQEFYSYHAEAESERNAEENESKVSAEEAIVIQYIFQATTPYYTEGQHFILGYQDSSLNLAEYLEPLPIQTNYTPAPTYAEMAPCETKRPIRFCVDIGAPRSVIGDHELSRLLRHLGKRQEKLKPSTNSFRFADTVNESLGTIVLPLRTPKHAEPILVEMDVVRANVPALLGLDAMDQNSMTPCIATNTLVNRIVKHGKPVDMWSIKLTRTETNHLFAPLKIPNLTRFTQVQLNKLHRQFFHPSPDKLFNLISKARPEHATRETRQALEEITARCDACQRIKAAPLRFRVSFGAGNVHFNERIIVDVMYLDGEPVLHIIYEGTHFSVAKFVPNVPANTLWKTILESWVTIYTGMPQRILVDEGSSFGEPFEEICRIGGVDIQRTGIEAHSSLNLGVHYHQPLRSVYRKLMSKHPGADKHLTLAFTVKAINDTLVLSGVVPSTLFFGEHTPVFTRSEMPKRRPTIDERAQISFEARKEMDQHMAKLS